MLLRQLSQEQWFQLHVVIPVPESRAFRSHKATITVLLMLYTPCPQSVNIHASSALQAYTDSNNTKLAVTRQFCQTCGTPLFRSKEKYTVLLIAGGTVANTQLGREVEERADASKKLPNADQHSNECHDFFQDIHMR